LHGPAVLKRGSRSAKARKVNAELWGCTEVTIAMLAFTATVVSNFLSFLYHSHFQHHQVYFILSGEGEFSEQGVDHDFRRFYDTHIALLTKESQKKGKHFQELVDYFNHELFPKAAEPQGSMDNEEMELSKAIDDEDEDEEEN
jgi:hypothetical protein